MYINILAMSLSCSCTCVSVGMYTLLFFYDRIHMKQFNYTHSYSLSVNCLFLVNWVYNVMDLSSLAALHTLLYSFKVGFILQKFVRIWSFSSDAT
jgi:hypothetical protein